MISNVAVVAASLADQGERVMIFDYDAHHGNGTQAVFYDDPRVLFVSYHQWPLYPGTGSVEETGGGAGAGTTLNIPLPAGTTGDVYLQAFDEIVAPVAERFAPTWVIVSAGFDAHRDDPLTEMGLAAGDYGPLTRRVLSLVPAGRRLVMLEGGYDLDALTNCSTEVMRQLAGVSALPDTGAASAAGDVEGPTVGRPGYRCGRCGGAPLAAAGLVVIPDRFRPVLDELSPLSERFAAAGHRLYLVGGTVRDLLIGERARRLRLRRNHDGATGRDQGLSRRLGRRDLDPGRTLRHDRRDEGRPHLRDHDPSGRGVHRRLAQAARRLRRRDRDRSLASGLHRSTRWRSS